MTREIFYAGGGLTRYNVHLYDDGESKAYFYIESDRQKESVRSILIPRGISPLDWAKRHYEHFAEVVLPYWSMTGGLEIRDRDERMRRYLFEKLSQPTFDLEDSQ